MSDDLSIPNPGYRATEPAATARGRPAPAGMDPDTRRLMLFAGGLGAVLLALIGASALVGHRSSEMPVVAADPRPIRVKPDNPGGMKIDGAENDVFSGGTDTANAKLAPAGRDAGHQGAARRRRPTAAGSGTLGRGNDRGAAAKPTATGNRGQAGRRCQCAGGAGSNRHLSVPAKPSAAADAASDRGRPCRGGAARRPHLGGCGAQRVAADDQAHAGIC